MGSAENKKYDWPINVWSKIPYYMKLNSTELAKYYAGLRFNSFIDSDEKEAILCRLMSLENEENKTWKISSALKKTSSRFLNLNV